jgi:hypothetical protein
MPFYCIFVNKIFIILMAIIDIINMIKYMYTNKNKGDMQVQNKYLNVNNKTQIILLYLIKTYCISIK